MKLQHQQHLDLFSVLCRTNWLTHLYFLTVFNHFGFLEYMQEKINMHLNCISKNKAGVFKKHYNSPCRWVACFNHCSPRLDASRIAHLNGVSTQLVACRRDYLVDKQEDCGLIRWLLGRSWFSHHTVTASSEAVCWCLRQYVGVGVGPERACWYRFVLLLPVPWGVLQWAAFTMKTG